jgi:hypothetical protein
VKRAFTKAEEEAQEKEVLFLSRRLSLSLAQEAQLRSAMERAEEAVRLEQSSAKPAPPMMEDRLRAMVDEQKRRQEALNRELEQIFSPEQYQLYLDYETDSSNRDFQVWHEAPAEKPQ